MAKMATGRDAGHTFCLQTISRRRRRPKIGTLCRLGFTNTSCGVSLPREDFNMSRKYIDCRQIPSGSKCSLAISGSEDEVLDLAVIHGIVTHGHDDPYELRRELRSLLQDAPEANSASA
jgi:hypothetical protein